LVKIDSLFHQLSARLCLLVGIILHACPSKHDP